MKNKRTLKENGITLVALVVTIIILLILAGISIAQLTGSGLFENAKLAKEKSENAQQQEQQKLDNYQNTINGYLSDTTRNGEWVSKSEYDALAKRVEALENQLKTEDITSYMTLNSTYVTPRANVKLTKNGNTIVLTAYLNVVGNINGTATEAVTFINIDPQYSPKFGNIVEVANINDTSHFKLININQNRKNLFYNICKFWNNSYYKCNMADIKNKKTD